MLDCAQRESESSIVEVVGGGGVPHHGCGRKEGPLRSSRDYPKSGKRRQYVRRCSPEKIGSAQRAPSLRARMLARVASTRKIVDFAAQDLRDAAIAERDCRKRSRDLHQMMMSVHGGEQRRQRV